jgi:hypothetical protein
LSSRFASVLVTVTMPRVDADPGVSVADLEVAGLAGVDLDRLVLLATGDAWVASIEACAERSQTDRQEQLSHREPPCSSDATSRPRQLRRTMPLSRAQRAHAL